MNEPIQPAVNPCAICRFTENWTVLEDLTGLTEVKARGIAKMVYISKNDRNDGLHYHIEDELEITVHSKCYKKYAIVEVGVAPESRKRKILISPIVDLDNSRDNSSHFDESIADFHLDDCCIICTKKFYGKPKRSRNSVTNNLKDKIIDYHTDNDKINKEVSNSIISKLESEMDVDDLNLEVHNECRVKLYPERNNFECTTTPRLQNSITAIVNFIKNNSNNVFNMNDFEEELINQDLYIPSAKTIWNHLEQHFQDRLIVMNRKGSKTHCCLSETGFDVFKNSHKQNNVLDDDKIVESAAKIILKDIDQSNEFYEKDFYPASDTMFDKVKEIPSKLKNFLTKIFLNDSKKTFSKYETRLISVAHAIMCGAFHVKILSPLQISVGVTFHRKFGSKELVDMCHSMGFSCAYSEVLHYVKSAAEQKQISLNPGGFVQFFQDNGDKKVSCVVENKDIHCLGTICVITPKSSLMPRLPFQRKTNLTAQHIANLSRIEIVDYGKSPGEGLKNYVFPPVSNDLCLTETKSSKLTSFWIFNKILVPKTMGWNGFIENLTATRVDYEVSEIHYEPFINAPPSDYNTLYTAILSCIDKASKLKMKTCIITFDQQLYIKARDILGAMGPIHATMKVVIRLGGFHTALSFMSGIGFIMKDTGINEVMEMLYGENTVKHILDGHQYSRALRAHILVLFTLVSSIFHKIKDKDVAFTRNYWNFFILHYRSWPKNLEDFESQDFYQHVTEVFEKELQKIENVNPTCNLWVQYCRMVFLLLDFMFAEKSGDWDLHLATVERMIPFFHASGRIHYAKSAQIYLDDMKKLKFDMNQREYERFTKGGYWTCRRVVKFFSGIFTDQTIEQTLMRILKIEGGLFKRSVTDSVAFQWLQAFTYIKDVILGLENFTDVISEKNFQHKDSTDGRIERDRICYEKIKQFFEQFDPFCEEESEKMINIANGMSSNAPVNCYKAFDVGIAIMNGIAGTKYGDVKLSKSNFVKTMNWSNSQVQIGDKKLPIEQGQLLHRACLLKVDDDEMRKNLTFELALAPPQYYDEFGMLKNKKSELLTKFSEIPETVHDCDRAWYVIDGGYLLHKVQMETEKEFRQIVQSYVNYIIRHYGANRVLVVFDGYEALTIKSAERERRERYVNSPVINFNEMMKLKISQEKFLHNSKNKTKFIQMLRNALESNGIQSVQCEGDADRTIVIKAIEIADDNPSDPVIMVAEDTDIAVLMAALTPNHLKIFMLKPPRGKVPQKVFSSRSLDELAEDVKDNILFLHAASGCDTVSATKGFGKLALFKVFEKNPDLYAHAEKFKESEISVEDFVDNGIQIYLAMYKQI